MAHRVGRKAETADDGPNFVEGQGRPQGVREERPLLVIRPGGVKIDEAINFSPRVRA